MASDPSGPLTATEVIETVADQNSVAIHFRTLRLAFSGTITVSHPPPTPARRNDAFVEQNHRCHWKPLTAIRITGFGSRPSPKFPVPVYSETQVLQLGQLGRISNPDLSCPRWCWNPSRGRRAPQGTTAPFAALNFLISMFRPVD